MCEAICPYKGKCTSEGTKCASCSRNTGRKDYYIPDNRDWYTPYYPQYPYTTPWWQYPYQITCGSSTYINDGLTWSYSVTGTSDKTNSE